ncbi:DUF1330 domain-containing protein [Jiella pacifica]|uniref:DUF1330 domain-containing protein n=1 Tax=Jiella pacifica TaxID=2696469 RepID=A0A6N9T931_9HYPH|nr:DUF1330 domain-containing protein [Jiella pacifica]NDW05408.1 DUF1330 domain-containing protein [Jiella pacifica]
MAKGYWIASIDVRDPEGYKAYVAAAKPAFEAHGAKFLARGGAVDALEGKARSRNVIIEFDSLETARACYASDDYQKAKAIRQSVADGDIVIVEGYDG